MNNFPGIVLLAVILILLMQSSGCIRGVTRLIWTFDGQRHELTIGSELR